MKNVDEVHAARRRQQRRRQRLNLIRVVTRIVQELVMPALFVALGAVIALATIKWG